MLPRKFIEPCGSYQFALEPLTDALVDELRPLHAMHWQETEKFRHGLKLDANYARMQELNALGRYVVFTARLADVLVGNCAMHLFESMHTKTLGAKEDTLFVVPEHRVGRMPWKFIDYVERVLKAIGASEIYITAKMGTRSLRIFEARGYRQTAIEYHKLLEASHVQP